MEYGGDRCRGKKKWFNDCKVFGIGIMLNALANFRMPLLNFRPAAKMQNKLFNFKHQKYFTTHSRNETFLRCFLLLPFLYVATVYFRICDQVGYRNSGLGFVLSVECNAIVCLPNQAIVQAHTQTHTS